MTAQARYPHHVPGARVEHLGSPGSFGEIVETQPHLYATTPEHADVIVRYADGSTHRAGFASLRVIETQR
jgi:hypothetical protein